MEQENLENMVRGQIRRKIIMDTQIRAPIGYEANEMLDVIVDIEMRQLKDKYENRDLGIPYYEQYQDGDAFRDEPAVQNRRQGAGYSENITSNYFFLNLNTINIGILLYLE